MSSPRRLIGTVLLVDVLSLAVFFAAAVYGYSANEVVPGFAFRWELAGALLSFFRWLPALQFLAVAIALGTSEGESRELIAASIIPAAILSALLAAGALAAQPAVQAGRAAMLRASEQFGASMAEAKVALGSGDLAKAEGAIATAREISPTDRRLDELSAALSAARARAGLAPPAPPGGTLPPPADASGARAYYLKALSLSQKGQLMEAHELAAAAAKMDPTYVDAQRLAAQTWEKLKAASVDQADKDRAALFARKVEGYSLLESNDAIGAYRIFSELAEKHGADPDVRRYLAQSLSAVRAAAFFKAEVDEAFAGYILGPVFLRVPDRSGLLRIVAAKDVAWAADAAYFRDIEYLEASTDGEGVLRAQAMSAYGKLTGGKLFLTCVDKQHPATSYVPTWKVGPPNGIGSVVELALTPDTVYRATASMLAPDSLSIPAAWKAASESPLYGVDTQLLIFDLLRRSALPFAVFTAAALGVFAGVRFRKRKGEFSRGYYVLVPLMAVALVPVSVLTERADRLIAAWSSHVLPGLGALGVAAGIRALVLFLAILVMAGARNDRSARFRS
ncbi:MAG TPA: hypothetical protein VMC79_11435 [Rectinemataceae bacterium]|nr:hypothetical protein [Rectinemataceae bacterium]